MTRIALGRPDGYLVGTDSGEGPLALLLHAGGERRSVWTPVSETLAGLGYRTVAFDLRGHGESTGRDANRLPPFAADVAAMLGAFDAMPVVVGASLGGLAALLALGSEQTRAQAAGLVLVDVVPRLDPGRVRAFLAETVGNLAARPLVDDILDRTNALTIAARSIDLPALLVRGGRSPVAEHDVDAFMFDMPGARVDVIEGAGHLVARDSPHELAGAIAAQLGHPDVRSRRSGHTAHPRCD
jgi:pimeloyl-ACP methyl ester carboxylesterase